MNGGNQNQQHLRPSPQPVFATARWWVVRTAGEHTLKRWGHQSKL